MTIASFAGFAFANDLPLTGEFSLASGLALTDMPGFFYILAMVNVPGLADTLIFADKPGLVVITVANIVRTHNRRCHIAATKLIGRHAC